MGWQLTKGTSFENIRDLLQRINSRCESKHAITAAVGEANSKVFSRQVVMLNQSINQSSLLAHK